MSPGYTHLLFCQKVKGQGQGHKVQKHISSDRVAGINLHSVEWPASSWVLDYTEANPSRKVFRKKVHVYAFRRYIDIDVSDVPSRQWKEVRQQ